MLAKLDRLWVWFLFKVDGWACRELQRAHGRDKARWLKHELEVLGWRRPQSFWKN